MCLGRWLIHNPLGLPRLPSSHAIRPFLRSSWHLLHLLLSACGGGGEYFVTKDEPWRETEERACLASGVVQESPFLKTKLSLGGPSVCGAERPFELAAADGGRVSAAAGGAAALPDDPAGQPLGVDGDRAGGAAHLRRPAGRVEDRRILRLPADEQRLRRAPLRARPRQRARRIRVRAGRWAQHLGEERVARRLSRSARSCARCARVPASTSRPCSAPTTTATTTTICTSTWRGAGRTACAPYASDDRAKLSRRRGSQATGNSMSDSQQTISG